MSLDDDPTQLPDDKPSSGSLSPGGRFGQYKIIRLLGRGGMGEVYEAEHTVLGKRYALKLLSEEIVGRGSSEERFKREAKVMAQLHHDNILEVDDFGETDGRCWLRMPLVSGATVDSRTCVSLSDAMEARRLWSADETLVILSQILSGLGYAHQAGVVHRDLKPGNLLLDSNSKIKIADFGLVRLAGEQWVQSQVQLTVAHSMTIGSAETVLEGGSSSGSTGTSTKALLGTFEYMAPEQKEGQEADARSDLYAVGLIAYRMLTGEKTIGMSLPSELVAGLDLAWDTWIKKAIAGNPEARFQSAEAMLEALPSSDSVNPASPTLRRAGRGDTNVRGKKSRAFRPGWAIAAIIIIGCGLSAWWFFGDRGQVTSDEGQGSQSIPVAHQESSNKEQSPETREALAERDSSQSKTTRPMVMLRLDPADALAKVWLGPLSELQPDEDGVLSIENLDTGDYELIVQAAGYQPVVTRLNVPDSGIEQTIRLVPIRGMLDVVTSPGAQVIAIDEQGKETRLGVADRSGKLLSENLLRIGKYRIRLSADKRQGVELPVELGIGRMAKLEQPLAPDPGQLRVITVPTGADVSATTTGWNKAGTTPLTLQNVPTEQPIEIKVSYRGYRSESQRITMEAAQIKTLNLGTLVAEAGSLKLVTRDQRQGTRVRDWEVTLNGEQLSKSKSGSLSGLLFEGLEVGEHELIVSHPSYESRKSRVTIRDNQTTTEEIKLKPKPGTLTVSVSPSSADWELLSNGTSLGKKSSYSLTAEQSQSLQIKARGFKTESKRIELPAAGTENWSVALVEQPGPTEGSDWTVELPGGESIDLKWIKSGSFMMGSPSSEKDRESDEKQHSVRLSRGYWLGKYEVTVGSFGKFVSETGYRTDAEKGDGMYILEGGKGEKKSGRNWKNVFAENKENPVVGASWNDAMAFCKWLTERERAAGRLPESMSYTLPTEAQWEYACRAGTKGRFYTGNNDSDLDKAGWYNSNAGSKAHPVGQKSPNAWGLYDMHGNVWEWCSDRYGDYPSGSVTNPMGPSSGAYRVTRGGSWNYYALHCRSAIRSWGSPGYSNFNLGFRLALQGSTR
ncbi:MAG: SUMF1/EgtB/PvdO family nonheme iron enzyme [Puniceicoccaceae bacterium]